MVYCQFPFMWKNPFKDEKHEISWYICLNKWTFTVGFMMSTNFEPQWREKLFPSEDFYPSHWYTSLTMNCTQLILYFENFSKIFIYICFLFCYLHNNLDFASWWQTLKYLFYRKMLLTPVGGNDANLTH